MSDDRPITDTDQGEFDERPETEPKSGLAVGVWFEDDSCWIYKGTLPVVIQFESEPYGAYLSSYVVSRCPPCERSRLGRSTDQSGRIKFNKVKRWLILPS